MLKVRILTALVLAFGILLVILAMPAWVYTAFILAIVILGAWEWSRLAGLRCLACRILNAAFFGILFLAAHWIRPISPHVWAWIAVLWWLLVLLRIPAFRASAPRPGFAWPEYLSAFPTLLPFAILSLTIYSWHPYWAIWSFLIIAASDIGAYFTGRRFGARKLVPQVSPGKTWEGLWGGLLASGIVGTLGALISISIGLETALAGFLLGLGTGLFATIGDLNESMLKRRTGAKDSSAMLPGHGGVLDRVDSLTAAVPFFSLGLMVMGWH